MKQQTHDKLNVWRTREKIRAPDGISHKITSQITTKWNVTIACQIYIKPKKAGFKMSNAVNGNKIR